MRLKIHSYKLNIWASLKAAFLHFLNIKTCSFWQAENQNDEDGTFCIVLLSWTAEFPQKGYGNRISRYPSVLG
jgi:hypothetical protein